MDRGRVRRRRTFFGSLGRFFLRRAEIGSIRRRGKKFLLAGSSIILVCSSIAERESLCGHPRTLSSRKVVAVASCEMNRNVGICVWHLSKVSTEQVTVLFSNEYVRVLDFSGVCFMQRSGSAFEISIS
jgi:hypothetical protein